MTISNSPPTIQSFVPEPGAQTEQELVYELFLSRKWTEELYLVFSENLNRPIELSDGRMVILPMPNAEHQDILLELAARAKIWLQQTNMGRVMVAPHPIRLWPGKYREPDIMIWRTENLHRIGEKDSDPPDLAVEIHSPSNPEPDQETKFQEYAQAGIPEYWMIDPQARMISVYSLENRVYKLVSRFRPDDRAKSLVLAGFEIAVDDLFSAK